jgi:hypothetical protein
MANVVDPDTDAPGPAIIYLSGAGFKIIIGSGSDHNYCENIQLALYFIEISRRRS